LGVVAEWVAKEDLFLSFSWDNFIFRAIISSFILLSDILGCFGPTIKLRFDAISLDSLSPESVGVGRKGLAVVVFVDDDDVMANVVVAFVPS
jgi:hypothetical protein